MRPDRRGAVLLALGVGVTLLAAAYLVAVGTVPAYRNPVLDNDAPDPAVIRAPDGAYYAYTTQAYFGAQFVNVPILTSTDLVHWELVGDVFPENPEWARRSPGDMWAPHMTRWDDGTYRLYFSAGRRDAPEMAIGVATASDPTGPFTDAGGPIVTGHTFSAIDPFVLQTDEETFYLYWGSAGEPIRAQRLAKDGLSLVGDPIEVLSPSGRNYEELIEGPLDHRARRALLSPVLGGRVLRRGRPLRRHGRTSG